MIATDCFDEFIRENGLQYVINGVVMVTTLGNPITGFPEAFTRLGQGKLFGSVYFTIVFALVLGVLLPASLGLCAVNLLPVASLDGGRILSCLLSLTLGADAARRVLRLLSLFLLSLLWLLSVYALLRAGQFLSLFVFSFSLLVRCMVH